MILSKSSPNPKNPSNSFECLETQPLATNSIWTTRPTECKRMPLLSPRTPLSPVGRLTAYGKLAFGHLPKGDSSERKFCGPISATRDLLPRTPTSSETRRRSDTRLRICRACRRLWKTHGRADPPTGFPQPPWKAAPRGRSAPYHSHLGNQGLRPWFPTAPQPLRRRISFLEKITERGLTAYRGTIIR